MTTQIHPAAIQGWVDKAASYGIPQNKALELLDSAIKSAADPSALGLFGSGMLGGPIGQALYGHIVGNTKGKETARAALLPQLKGLAGSVAGGVGGTALGAGAGALTSLLSKGRIPLRAGAESGAFIGGGAGGLTGDIAGTIKGYKGEAKRMTEKAHPVQTAVKKTTEKAKEKLTKKSSLLELLLKK